MTEVLLAVFYLTVSCVVAYRGSLCASIARWRIAFAFLFWPLVMVIVFIAFLHDFPDDTQERWL
jgi:hypothetical protein